MATYPYPPIENSTPQVILADEINGLVGPPLDLNTHLYYGNTKYETDRVSGVSGEIEEVVGSPGAICAKLFLRPKGILILLEGQKESLLWAIPFYTISIYSSREIGIYSGKNCIKLQRSTSFEQQRFLRNLMDLHSLYQTNYHPF